jgi:hypothetical protein
MIKSSIPSQLVVEQTTLFIQLHEMSQSGRKSVPLPKWLLYTQFIIKKSLRVFYLLTQDALLHSKQIPIAVHSRGPGRVPPRRWGVGDGTIPHRYGIYRPNFVNRFLIHAFKLPTNTLLTDTVASPASGRENWGGELLQSLFSKRILPYL